MTTEEYTKKHYKFNTNKAFTLIEIIIVVAIIGILAAIGFNSFSGVGSASLSAKEVGDKRKDFVNELEKLDISVAETQKSSSPIPSSNDIIADRTKIEQLSVPNFTPSANKSNDISYLDENVDKSVLDQGLQSIKQKLDDASSKNPIPVQPSSTPQPQNQLEEEYERRVGEVEKFVKDMKAGDKFKIGKWWGGSQQQPDYPWTCYRVVNDDGSGLKGKIYLLSDIVPTWSKFIDIHDDGGNYSNISIDDLGRKSYLFTKIINNTGTGSLVDRIFETNNTPVNIVNKILNTHVRGTILGILNDDEFVDYIVSSGNKYFNDSYENLYYRIFGVADRKAIEEATADIQRSEQLSGMIGITEGIRQDPNGEAPKVQIDIQGAPITFLASWLWGFLNTDYYIGNNNLLGTQVTHIGEEWVRNNNFICKDGYGPRTGLGVRPVIVIDKERLLESAKPSLQKDSGGNATAIIEPSLRISLGDTDSDRENYPLPYSRPIYSISLS